MNKTRFTGGDWVATNYGYEKISINGVNGVEVCSCWNQANAHLIAVAPEMYEMLDNVANKLFDLGDTKSMREIEKLLAKARGEQ
ncbi:hypothetical protein CL622_01915 [archaeon]|nr:hypothetical protein [archaeon]